MEQLYTDFTTKLLPQIQSGLVITKDYFLDLFGRYIKYLIITDSIDLAVSLVLLPCFGVLLYRSLKHQEKDSWGNWSGKQMLFFWGGLAGVLFFFISVCFDVSNLVKDIYVPEVRIYEEIKMHNQ
jgi:hypothetical protein